MLQATVSMRGWLAADFEMQREFRLAHRRSKPTS